MKIVEIIHPPHVNVLIERFGSCEHSFVLDSSLSGVELGKWSFFGANPFLVFAGKEGSYMAYETANPDRKKLYSGKDGLDVMRSLMAQYPVSNKSDIPFIGGAVGFIAYDYGRQLEDIPLLTEDDRLLNDLYFGFYDGIAALNHETGILSLIALGLQDDADRTIEELQTIIRSDSRQPTKLSAPLRSAWEWNFTHSEYLAAVRQVRDYIASGDVYQVNLSQRARCRFEGCPLQLYHRLRVHNPAPYSALIRTNEQTVLSTSPEQFLRKRGHQIETRPIKGTRPRGMDASEDAYNAAALLDSEKDRAELLMVVDLERNDLGRVAEFGSVQVERLYHQEHYASVIHQMAVVKARLHKNKDLYDCIRALFPGGSITGAPKVRAMEIIEELEPTRRGVYTGAIGYIGFDEDVELNIAIRTLHLNKGYLDYQVGGGIVWDSNPEDEYQETLDKGRAIHEAIEQLCRRS